MSDATNTSAGAWGIGLATVTPEGRVLDTWYPRPTLGLRGIGESLRDRLGSPGGGGTPLDADV
ncbi:MAG TPA: hypothetical protein VK360_07405, partial [Acidimicrobiales bacterium]|nr:hypothetical protein [Acidimicrobiales bacterium]